MGGTSAALAAVGTLVFMLVLAIPTQVSAGSSASSSRAPISGSIAGPDLLDGSFALRLVLPPEPVIVAAAPPPPAPAPVAKAAPPAAPPALAPEPFVQDALVVASWYGPGFYGNRTACGQVYTPEIMGVAHRELPCGTKIDLTFRGKTVTVTVIDRGPYIAGRTLDLSNATRAALGCTDLCTVRMHLR